MLGGRINFKAYAINVRGKMTNCSLKAHHSKNNFVIVTVVTDLVAVLMRKKHSLRHIRLLSFQVIA